MQDIGQWDITFRANVAEVTVSPDPHHNEEQIMEGARQWRKIQKCFPEKLQGLKQDEYSAQRLFAAISGV